MRTVWWALAIYEGVIGISELANSFMSASTSGASSMLATVEALPSAASLLPSTSGTTSAVVDLATAGAIYYFALR